MSIKFLKKIKITARDNDKKIKAKICEKVTVVKMAKFRNVVHQRKCHEDLSCEAVA